MFALKFVMRTQIENYFVFLVTALFPWQWFCNSVNASVYVLLGNSGMIKKTVFPKELLVAATVSNDFVHFLLTIPIILFVVSGSGIQLHLSIIYCLPLLVLLQFFLVFGLALFISSCNLFFRDLERLTQIAINILFWLTPIIYSMEMLPPQFKKPIFYFNPMASLMGSYRQLFLEGSLNIECLGITAGYAALSYLVGQRVFRYLKPKFAEAL
jgi:lipopolysaccharide transport system permease protein